MQHKAWVESTLRELSFVEWDRYYTWKQGVVVHGWIDKEDQYKDFVSIEFNTSPESLFGTIQALKNTLRR